MPTSSSVPGTSLSRVTEPGALPVVPVEPGSPLMERWLRTNFTVFLQPLLDAEGLAHRQTIMPRDHRYLATLDGEQVVATYRAWDTHVTAPGGAKVPADAVSGVTVLPTHRRRGLLTRMIVPDLADAAERGLAVAILIAAEAPIYGRFGFGAATETAHWRVDVPTARLRPEVHVEGTVTVVSQAELREVAPAVFEAARRPGALDISDLRWDRELGRNAEGPERTCLVHRDAAGAPQGFAAFRGEERWSDRRIESVAHLERFQAATPQAYTALWSVLTSLDLMATVDADEHAVDEPLPTLLVDPRAARQVSRCDFQWSRLLDPVAALSARTYESAGAVTVEVVDPAGWAAGTFTIEADAAGAGACRRSGSSPEVTLPVDVLSALWLGGGDLYASALAGRADEHAPGALARLARLLRTTRAPWTPTWF